MFHPSPPDPKFLFPSRYLLPNGMFIRLIGYGWKIWGSNTGRVKR